MKRSYLEQMRAHVDHGGQLNHQNGVELLAEVERLHTAVESWYLANYPEIPVDAYDMGGRVKAQLAKDAAENTLCAIADERKL